MNRLKKNGVLKIAACIAVYATFVLVTFSFSIKNQSVLVLLSTFIGSGVVVASYHEYRTTFSNSIEGKKKASAPAAPIMPYDDSGDVTPVEIPQEPADNFIIPAEDGVADFDMTVISPAVLDELEATNLDEELKDEVLSIVSGIPEDERLPYIKKVFGASIVYEEDY
ncbi:MAG: hypothetical protein ACTSUE_20540 [Promethearchaeota archaeon]